MTVRVGSPSPKLPNEPIPLSAYLPIRKVSPPPPAQPPIAPLFLTGAPVQPPTAAGHSLKPGPHSPPSSRQDAAGLFDSHAAYVRGGSSVRSPHIGTPVVDPPFRKSGKKESTRCVLADGAALLASRGLCWYTYGVGLTAFFSCASSFR